MKILITGAFGMVGKSIQKIVNLNPTLDDFIFLSRNDCDLRSQSQVDVIFEKHQPDIVIHLASCVGGVYDNMSKNYTYLSDNVKININIVDACKKYNVKKLINVLSTCIFPDKNINYPLTSDQLHNGLPHSSNIGYAYSKRVLHLASSLLTNDTNIKIVNLTPTNLYGEFDNYNLVSSHVIPGLVHKAYISKQTNTPLKVYGTGKAIRQFLYSDDFAKVILKFANTEFDEKCISCIVSPPESDELSIKNLVEKIVNTIHFSGETTYHTSFSDGQLKKTTNNDELYKYISDFTFTPIDTGLTSTINYFVENYDTVRK